MNSKYYCCPGVVYRPSTLPNMPFQRQRKCIFHWRGWAWLTKWDKVKSRGIVIDWCTCELHDSYFRSMTKIEWATALLYNSVKTRSQSVFWRPEVGEICGRESQHSAESCASGPPVEQPWRTERNPDGHKSGGGQYVAVLFGLQLPLTRNLSNKVRGIFF